MKSIKNTLKKKRVLYPFICISEFIILLMIAEIFGLETAGTLYGEIANLIMLATVIVLLMRIVQEYKIKSPNVKRLYFLIAIMIFGYIFTWYIRLTL